MLRAYIYPKLQFKVRSSCTLLNAAVYVLHENKSENIGVHCIIIFKFTLKYYTTDTLSWTLSLATFLKRTFSGSVRPQNKKTQPQLKKQTFLQKIECMTRLKRYHLPNFNVLFLVMLTGFRDLSYIKIQNYRELRKRNSHVTAA